MLYELWQRVAKASIAAMVIVVAAMLSDELAKALSDPESDVEPDSATKK
jgi:hypothetical protein